MREFMGQTSRKNIARTATVLMTALALWLCTAPGPSQAAGGCDPQFMQSLKGRGYAEAKRESARNKNLLYKPDSVLEYSCFFSFLVHVQNFNSMPISPGAWDYIVSTPAFNYVASNFGHVYLGGHFAVGGPEVPEGQYFCDAMARMWEFAHCINANQFTDAENFFDFNWYVNNDPRKYPAGYAACVPPNTPIDLREAFNGRQAEWAYTDAAATADGTAYLIDPVRTYLNLTDWTVNDDCGPPVPTGIRVYRKDRSYPEYFCAKPGCTYVPGAADAVGECVK